MPHLPYRPRALPRPGGLQAGGPHRQAQRAAHPEPPVSCGLDRSVPPAGCGSGLGQAGAGGPPEFPGAAEGNGHYSLAGPLSTCVLALVSLGIGSLLFHFGPANRPVAYLLLFLCQLSVLNVGLGLFNLIPIPPLDGSRVVEMFLPERAYRWVLRYERYLIVAVVLLAWMGFFGGPLYRAMAWVLQGMCEITQFPFSLIVYNFF